MTASSFTQSNALVITWNPLPDTYRLPDDPVEDEIHPQLAAALTDALNNWPSRPDHALMVSNFALCATVNDRTLCKAPDWMYVQPVPPRPDGLPRRSYTPHAEGPVPLIVMEFLSASNQGEFSMRRTGKIGKWFFYEQIIRVPIYAIFRPRRGTLEVYRLNDTGHYQPETADDQGRFAIPELGLSLGIWQGTRQDRTGCWLRWWTEVDGLVPWSEERATQAEQRAEQEQQRAEKLAERLRQLGVDPDSL